MLPATQAADTEIDFSNNESLQPLPAEWYRVKGVDLDDLAMVDAIVDDSVDPTSPNNKKLHPMTSGVVVRSR